MKKIEQYIKILKSTPRINYLFSRRRIDKGNGKKTLGWVMQRENDNNIYENVNFYELQKIKYRNEII